MLARIKEPFAKLSNYPRLRILLIIAAVIVVFVVLMNMLTPKNAGTPPSAVQPVSANPHAAGKPVSSSAASQYNQLKATNQKQELQKAVSSGGTIFQNSFDNEGSTTTTTTPPKPLNTSNTSAQAAPASSTATTPEQFSQQKQNSEATNNNPQLQQQLNDLQNQLAQQTTRNNQVDQVENNMRTAVTSLTNSWTLPTAASVQGAAPTAPSNNGTAASGPVIIKAGTILFGVIDTALDSDQPGTPVMATIVTGPYKGAKLLGAFQAENQALVVQFNMMSLPTLTRTIGINAYALDQNTANNAIATSVDNHYLLRYGMLFASAFMQGFGNAYQNYNYTCPPGTANCTLINSNGTPNTQATTKTAAYQGLGQVGTTLGQVAAQQFNTPPTIKVDQGTGIGVLFMSDVSLPAN